MGMFDKMAKKAAETAEAIAATQGPLPEAAPAPSPVGAPRSPNCAACGSPTLHESPEGRFSWDTGEAGRGRAVMLVTSRMVTASPVSAVVCVTCGHLAHFVRDPRRLAEVAAAWPRLGDGAA